MSGRAFLIEHSAPVKESRVSLRRELPDILEGGENGVSPRMRQLIAVPPLAITGASIAEQTHEIETMAKRSDDCRWLVTVPGIGPLSATALVAAVGNAAMLSKGRELAAWFGLLPRRHSTDGQSKLLGVGKQDNRYVRMLFIHRARSGQEIPSRIVFNTSAALRRTLRSNSASRSWTSDGVRKTIRLPPARNLRAGLKFSGSTEISDISEMGYRFQFANIHALLQT